MSAHLPTLISAYLIVCASGCAMTNWTGPVGVSDVQHAAYTIESEATKTVHIVGHGWHTGIVLAVNDISPDDWPEARHLTGLDHVEVGWGDEGFYRAKKITIPLCLRAAFLPTPSVLHVAGIRGSVRDMFPVSDIVELNLTDDQHARLCRFVAATHTRDSEGDPISLGPGIYGESVFYRAEGNYYFPNTCNVWTARALKDAGLPIRSFGAIRAESVLSQVSDLGRGLQESPSGIKHAALFGE